MYQLIRQLSVENENQASYNLVADTNSARGSLINYLSTYGCSNNYLWVIVLLGVHPVYRQMVSTVIPLILQNWSITLQHGLSEVNLLGESIPSSPMQCKISNDEGKVTLPAIDKVLKDFFDQIGRLFPDFNTSLCEFDFKTEKHTGKPRPLSDIFNQLQEILTQADLFNVLQSIVTPLVRYSFQYCIDH